MSRTYNEWMVTLDSMKPTSQTLPFLTELTGQDENDILSHALQVGLNMLSAELAEQQFIAGKLARGTAVQFLGAERVSAMEQGKELGWPVGFFTHTLGAWAGEPLARGEQGGYEQRDALI